MKEIRSALATTTWVDNPVTSQFKLLNRVRWLVVFVLNNQWASAAAGGPKVPEGIHQPSCLIPNYIRSFLFIIFFKICSGTKIKIPKTLRLHSVHTCTWYNLSLIDSVTYFDNFGFEFILSSYWLLECNLFLDWDLPLYLILMLLTRGH